MKNALFTLLGILVLLFPTQAQEFNINEKSDAPELDTIHHSFQKWNKMPPTSISTYGRLRQNYPNPFSEITKIRYDIATPAQVKLNVFDAAGTLVDVLVSEKQIPGTYEVTWEPSRRFGIPLACGHYYYQLQIDGHVQVNKMIAIQ